MTLSSADQTARARFQSGLLAWLRAADDPSGLREMVAVVRGHAIDDPQNVLLWRSAEAFLQALLDGTLPADADAKQLCRRLERQLGRNSPPDDQGAEGELREALFAFVSNRGPAAENDLTNEAAGSGLPAALHSTLAAAADTLPLVSFNTPSPSRFSDEQKARWRLLAAQLDAAWMTLLGGGMEDARVTSTRFVELAIELNDPATLRLADALADAVGRAEDPAVRERPAFRAAMSSALDILMIDEGPDQAAFDTKADQLCTRLAQSGAPLQKHILPGGPRPWFAEDAQEWLQDMRAAIDAVPPKRLTLLGALRWLAEEEAGNVMAIRGLAILALKIFTHIRADDLDRPNTHALVHRLADALEAAAGELGAGHPPKMDETIFEDLRAFDRELAEFRKLRNHPGSPSS